MAAGGESWPRPEYPRPLCLWLNPQYARHIVKGNFMALSTRPKTVEQGEWMAHQAVEHYRILWNFVRVIHEKEEDGTSICNPTTCPKMSAGASHSYTWLNSRLEPREIPAHEYMTLMQRWVSSRIDDGSIFPTDSTGASYASPPATITTTTTTTPPAGAAAASNSNNNSNTLSQLSGTGDWVGRPSGFPREFLSTCKNIFLQMFRVYAHLYWDHFVEPFYHFNLEKQLNSCFSHFVLTATALGMLTREELEPMQLLIDLWAADGTFPAESKAYAYANLKSGKYLLQLGGAPR